MRHGGTEGGGRGDPGDRERRPLAAVVDCGGCAGGRDLRVGRHGAELFRRKFDGNDGGGERCVARVSARGAVVIFTRFRREQTFLRGRMYLFSLLISCTVESLRNANVTGMWWNFALLGGMTDVFHHISVTLFVKFHGSDSFHHISKPKCDGLNEHVCTYEEPNSETLVGF